MFSMHLFWVNHVPNKYNKFEANLNYTEVITCLYINTILMTEWLPSLNDFIQVIQANCINKLVAMLGSFLVVSSSCSYSRKRKKRRKQQGNW